MRRFVLCLGLLLIAAGAGRADPFTLDNIQFWAGSGSKRAGFIVDFKGPSGPQSFAWGFRWDGTATGEDMMRAIAAANGSGLFASIKFYSGFGYAVNGFGYDLNKNGIFSTTPALTFPNGIAEADPLDVRDSVEVGDLYTEGWNTDGFWSYFIKDNATSPWVSTFGFSNRVLSDGNFDGWAFDANFVDPAPEPSDPISVAAVPEPGSMILLALTGCTMLIVWRIRRRDLAPA
jgi:hypothetical protein